MNFLEIAFMYEACMFVGMKALLYNIYEDCNGLLYFMHLLGVAHWENAKHLWGERKRQGRLRWCVVRGHMQTGHSQLMTYNKYTYVRTYIQNKLALTLLVQGSLHLPQLVRAVWLGCYSTVYMYLAKEECALTERTWANTTI